MHFLNNRWKGPFYARTGIFVLVFCAVFPLSVYGFRCGSRLVSPGDRAVDVLEKCGSPDEIQDWVEERVLRDYGSYDDERFPHRSPFWVKIQVKVEEWVYNLGPTRFMRILRFENGKLVEIMTGKRGHPK